MRTRRTISYDGIGIDHSHRAQFSSPRRGRWRRPAGPAGAPAGPTDETKVPALLRAVPELGQQSGARSPPSSRSRRTPAAAEATARVDPKTGGITAVRSRIRVVATRTLRL